MFTRWNPNFLQIKRFLSSSALSACNIKSNKFFSVKDEILDVLHNTMKPLVCLDTTILSRTVSYPGNLAIANETLKTIKTMGAVPVPLAVIDGKLTLGLTELEMERLANMELYQSEASRMDLSTALVNKTTVRTTLSAALSVANFLGIKIAVTGSLNGVQRNANSEGTYAISSSIPEIGRNSVSVVCSGLGPTVHLDKTMQFLTTASVTTATYGNTKDLPVFGCFNSGGRALSTMHSTSITDIAQLVLAHMDLGLKGLVIFVPASPPNALEFSTIEEALRQALTEAESEKFTFTEGNQFLCARVFEIVDFPESFIRDLYVSSAIKGSEIAMELWKIKGSSHL